MSAERCLILGGLGFLGSYVAQALIEAGYCVRVFDRLNVDTSNIDEFSNDIELYYGDLSNRTDVEMAIENVDYVFHFVGTTIPKTASDNPAYDLESNVMATLNFLEVAKKRDIKKIVFSSSGGTVYGLPNELPISEDHATDPISAYGISKLVIEKYIKYYAHQYDLDYIILRHSNPYGPRQSIITPQGAITHFLRSILEHKKIEIWGDGSVVRDYFFVKDLISLYQNILSCNVSNETFNIGKGTGYSLNEVIERIRSLLSVNPEIVYSKGRKIDINVNYLCVNKAERMLNWTATTDLEEGILETWNWLKATEKQNLTRES